MRALTRLVRYFCGAALVVAAPALAADPPSIDEIVRRTAENTDREREHYRCRVTVDAQIVDGKGKLKNEERSELEVTHDGKQQKTHLVKKWKDGKELGPAELVKAEREDEEQRKKNAEKNKSGGEFVPPLSVKGTALHKYTLLGQEQLWGHPAYVVKLEARERKVSSVDGTAWIDADRFIPLKGEYVPAKLPPHADWMKFHEQYELGADGYPIRTLLKIDGAGHFLMIKMGGRVTIRTVECKESKSDSK